jgi:hypothetical protein
VPAGTGVHRYQDVEFLVEGAPIAKELEALTTERRVEEVAEPTAALPDGEISLADLIAGKRRVAEPKADT